MSRGREAFAAYVRPELMAKLRAVALDIEYHRGFGNYLYYKDSTGREVEVLDCVGGFGACLLGHNHPALVACAQKLLADQVPIHAQASARGMAGLLGERLSAEIGRSTGRQYRVTFASTGAEAVEAALKHAEMERRHRIDQMIAGMRRARHTIMTRLREGSAHVPDALFAEVAGLLDGVELASSHMPIEALFAELARASMKALDRPPVFLAVAGAFHGKTSGALALTHRDEYRAPWRSMGPATVFLPLNQVAALQATVDRHTLTYHELGIAESGAVILMQRQFVHIAACFVEPIQGEGGVHEAEAAYLTALRAVADRAGFPLIIDEIQTGMGRTGTFLASEAAGVRGDYYLLSKSLGGGLAKISALVVERERYLDEFGYLHTSTFADDDFSCAIALETLQLIEREQLGRACQERGRYLLDRLRALKEHYPGQVRDVRGRGLMIGLELLPQPSSPAPLMRLLGEQDLLGLFASGYLLHEHGIRVLPTLSARSTLRLEPPALVTQADIDRLVGALEDLLVAMRDADMFRLSGYLVGRSREPGRKAPKHRRPAPARPASTPLVRVGFLAHFAAPGDLRDWDPSLSPLSEDECAQLLDRMSGTLEPFIVGTTHIRSELDAAVELTVVGLPFTAAQVMASMRAGGGDFALSLIDQGVERLRRLGCAVIGFGGHTSILTDNCRAIAASDVVLTSGNALTVAAAVETLIGASHDIPNRLGIVGAAGNLGMVLAEYSASELESMLLVGRPETRRRLERVAARISAKVKKEHGENAFPINVADNMAALRDCTHIITASNSAQPIIYPEHISQEHEEVVICDVAVPADVSPRVAAERPNAVVVRGGMMRLPDKQRIDLPGMNLPPGQCYGCLSETILLGLAGAGRHYSYGQLHVDKVYEISQLAELHGFEYVRPGRRGSAGQ